jgi:4-amino-4-deoxy-L-arabinose transferase-like glycosyltransferase
MVSGNISETTTLPLHAYSSSKPLWKRFFTGWYGPSLLIILLLAIFLNFWQLGQIGYSNFYYASGTRSMLSSWHNFFYVSFDPNGYVSIDKPPLDFWLQVLSAKILGFSPQSLMLPQALAGVFSVALLAHLVRRSFGSLAALAAALTLTVTPINVITNRNNDVDSMLVLVVLLAAWAVVIAAEKGSLRWLLLGLGLVGLGFNIKMAEAYLVVPAFVLLYLLTARRHWGFRIWHLTLALTIMVMISLSWAVAVDLTPPTQRPYVGSSGTNSALNLALGYNGLNRLLGHRPATPPAKNASTNINTVVPERPPGETGYPSPTRLFNSQLAGQISWLLPLALVGIVVLLWRRRNLGLQNQHFRGLLLWGVWFLTTAAFFSFAGAFHVYYMVMFAPAICALTGIGIGMLWHELNTRSWRGWFLSIALLITALVQMRFLSVFPTFSSRLTPLILGITLAVAIALLIIGLIRRAGSLRYISALLTVLGLCALLIAPTVWAIAPIVQQRNSGFPIAGPYPNTGPPPTPTVTTGSPSIVESTYVTLSPNDPALIHYLEEHQGTASYLFATSSSNFAAPIIVETGRAVMSIGGYSGGDHILTRAELVTLVREGVVRFFLLSSSRTIHSSSLRIRRERTARLSLTGGTTSWVSSICRAIAPTTWHPAVESKTLSLSSNLVLYDCGGVF